MRIYTELAPWFHLLTDPAGYADEAALTTRAIEAAADGPTETLLELGIGRRQQRVAPEAPLHVHAHRSVREMLELSRSINPECEHVSGDMRTLRLGRTFDAVFIHDAIEYMTTEDDLRAALETAVVHARPGGAVILTPDCVPRDAPARRATRWERRRGRTSLRYLEWTTDPDPDDTIYDVDFVLMLREPGRPLRVEHDHHVFGVFPTATWHRLFERRRAWSSSTPTSTTRGRASTRCSSDAAALDSVRKDTYPE